MPEGGGEAAEEVVQGQEACVGPEQVLCCDVNLASRVVFVVVCIAFGFGI